MENKQADFRDYTKLKKEKFDDEKTPTTTSHEQIKTETSIEKCFDRFQQLHCLDPKLANILHDQHISYLKKHFLKLPQSFECLDSSRPWIIYWILNSANLLNFKFDDDLLDRAINFLIKCRNVKGGFGGGPGQYSHLATTYGAVNALCIIGTPKALDAIDRDTLKEFFWSVREPDGSYRLHVGGEVDVRGAYCAISCSKLCNFSPEDEEKLFKGTGDWIASCQTYEGGFGGAPDLEAHGGYTFCGIAAMAMLGCTEKCKVEEILKWAVSRQMRFEGGFQGRTNKLVDGCYSFWVGAIIPIAEAVISKHDTDLCHLLKGCLFDRSALQEYILLCCQQPNGGLIDKPGKPSDPYHTCYTLSGISIAQHFEMQMDPHLLGHSDNELVPTHPLHNIPPLSVMKAFKYFSQFDQSNLYKPVISSDDEENNNDNNKRSSSVLTDNSEQQTIDRESSIETTASISEQRESSVEVTVSTSEQESSNIGADSNTSSA